MCDFCSGHRAFMKISILLSLLYYHYLLLNDTSEHPHPPSHHHSQSSPLTIIVIIIIITTIVIVIIIIKYCHLKVYLDFIFFTLQGHMQGELWGLGSHPSKPVFATVSDDMTLRVWAIEEGHRLINIKILQQPGRCVAYSPDGIAIAVGLKDGVCDVDQTFSFLPLFSFP